MIPLPGSLNVKRSKKAEELLSKKARAWIEAEERSPGVHASDLLDERKAFFQRTKQLSIPDRLVATFLVGKVLHAFVLNAVDGRNPADISNTDTGSFVSDELGFTYSPDSFLNGKIRELKTSRSFYEPKDVDRDLGMYIEQLLLYMAAKKHTKAQLWILFLNFKDENKKTAPAFRAYNIEISEEDMLKITLHIQERVTALKEAISDGNYKSLPLCREWKCGRGNCEYYEDCQPEGRYGTERFDKDLPRPKKAKVERQPKAGAVGSKSRKRSKGDSSPKG